MNTTDPNLDDLIKHLEAAKDGYQAAVDEIAALSRQLIEAQAERGQLYAESVKLRTVLDRALQHILGTWPRGDMVRQISDCLSPERPAHAAAKRTCPYCEGLGYTPSGACPDCSHAQPAAMGTTK